MEIVVHRPIQIHDSIRDYQLLVDGVRLIKIKPESKTMVSIPDSAQFIQAKIDWCCSPKFKVSDIKENQMTIKNTFGYEAVTAIPKLLYYLTLGRAKYLSIESK